MKMFILSMDWVLAEYFDSFPKTRSPSEVRFWPKISSACWVFDFWNRFFKASEIFEFENFRGTICFTRAYIWPFFLKKGSNSIASRGWGFWQGPNSSPRGSRAVIFGTLVEIEPLIIWSRKRGQADLVRRQNSDFKIWNINWLCAIVTYVNISTSKSAKNRGSFGKLRSF